VERLPLLYADGPDARVDRPAHVRAASALVRAGRGHLVVQDDALFLAAFGDAGVRATPLPSPDGVRQFDDGRGNKALKPDLEAACAWPTSEGEVLVAFGSGSTSRRERVLVTGLRPDGPSGARLVEAGSLYAAVRACLPSDAELNVEGAFRVRAGVLRLLQRGNGRVGVDAVVDVDGRWLDGVVAGAPPEPRVLSCARWSLGHLDGVRLTFTDGSPLDDVRWLFSATAEDSPDTVADGPVTGSVVGWADDDGGAWAPVIDGSGAIVRCKLEGLARVRAGEAWGVVDADDPNAPSELLRLRLDGPWPA
jgi:hypothetical protein